MKVFYIMMGPTEEYMLGANTKKPSVERHPSIFGLRKLFRDIVTSHQPMQAGLAPGEKAEEKP